jgi:hypothetical protein
VHSPPASLHGATGSSVLLTSVGLRLAFATSGGNRDGIKEALRANVSQHAVLMTNDARIYLKVAKQFAARATMIHSAGEDAREGGNTTNIV